MSLNIPSSILNYSSSVNVTIDLKKFGPRQTTSLVKMLKTGHIQSAGVPAVIAKHLRIQAGLPVIHFCSQKYFRWENIRIDSLDDFFNHFIAGSVVARMRETQRLWLHEAIDSAIQEKLQHGCVWGSQYFVQVMKPYKMPAYEGVLCDEVVIDMMKG